MTSTEQTGTGPNPVLEAALDYAEALRQYQAVDGPLSDGAAAMINESLAATEERLLALVAPPTAELRERFQRVNRALVEQTNSNNRLTGEIAALQRKLGDAQTELDEFKALVVRVAGRYADEHGWCETVDAGLGELGLERPKLSYTAQLTIIVDLHATMKAGREIPYSSDVHDALNLDAVGRAISNAVVFDDDTHHTGAVDEVVFEVSRVREVQV